MENQLTILSEGLDKKLEVLEEIQAYNLQQERAFTEGSIRLEDFDAAVEKKGELIEKLTKLDEGFEAFYQRLAQQLSADRAHYVDQIKELQEKIRLVTEMSVTIQAQEQRNKALVEGFFSKERDDICQGRRSSKAALNYYRSMNQSQYVPPQFMDSKK